MLSLLDCFVPRDEEVASKIMDGEAIIMNLGTGVYYSMDKVGALIWDLLESRHTLKDVIAALTRRYKVSHEQAEIDTRALVEQLLEQNLVVCSQNAGSNAAEIEIAVQEKASYEVPRLNIYPDMADLLAIDPPVPGPGDTPWKKPEDRSV